MVEKEYIEREAAKWHLYKEFIKDKPTACKAFRALETTPAADVVEVVRCKDCKHGPYKRPADGWCDIQAILSSGDPFLFVVGGRGTGIIYGALRHARQHYMDICPYICDDGYYTAIPDENGFCDRGERG